MWILFFHGLGDAIDPFNNALSLCKLVLLTQAFKRITYKYLVPYSDGRTLLSDSDDRFLSIKRQVVRLICVMRLFQIIAT